MEIAVVGAAASVALAADGSHRSLGVALTAVAPTIVGVERARRPRRSAVDDALLAAVAAAGQRAGSTRSATCAPASATAGTASGVMARRSVEAAARRAGGERIAVPVNRAIGIGAAS